jgi:hypothetical protein
MNSQMYRDRQFIIHPYFIVQDALIHYERNVYAILTTFLTLKTGDRQRKVNAKKHVQDAFSYFSLAQVVIFAYFAVYSDASPTWG